CFSPSLRLWVALAFCLLVLGGAGAWFAVRWATGRTPAPEPDAWEQAQAALAAEDLEQALAHLRRFLQEWPLHAEGHFLLARACRRADDFAGWQKHLETAQALGWSEGDIDQERLCMRAQTGDARPLEAALDRAGDEGPQTVLAVEALVKGYLAA